MKLAAAAAAVGDIAVGLAAQSLLEGHNLLLVCSGQLRARVVVSMNRASGTWVCLCHSGPAVEIGIEILTENSFGAAVGCSSPFLRGCESVTRCSSSGFVSAKVDVVSWPGARSLVLRRAAGCDSANGCSSAMSLVGPFDHHLCPFRLPSAVVPSSSHRSS